MLVVRDGELKTKIARIGAKGRNYAESQITGSGNEASRSDSAGGGYRERLHPTRRYPFQIRHFITKSKHGAEQIRQTDDGPHHVARPARRTAGNPSRPAGKRRGAERNGTERGIRSRRPPRERPKRDLRHALA